jgi:hypothetical protein
MIASVRASLRGRPVLQRLRSQGAPTEGRTYIRTLQLDRRSALQMTIVSRRNRGRRPQIELQHAVARVSKSTY